LSFRRFDGLLEGALRTVTRLDRADRKKPSPATISNQLVYQSVPNLLIPLDLRGWRVTPTSNSLSTDCTSMDAMASKVIIRDATTDDAEHITSIYNHYVRTSIATFQEEGSSTDELAAKQASIKARETPYLVAVDAEKSSSEVHGFAYADRWAERSAYRFSVESSIYLHPLKSGQGVGKRLLQALLDHLLQAGSSGGTKRVLAKISILPEQAAEDVPSCRLHMAFGFRTVGRLVKVGYKMDRWIDVVILELDLDDLKVSARP
jgi:L-amino acid N-acyltransferase